MGESLIIVQQGTPVVAPATVTFIGTGSAGTVGACRRLVFPSGTSPLLAPIVYSFGPNGTCLNPGRTLNFDKVPLQHPDTSVVKTIGGSKVIRFDGKDEDVVVTEVWEANRGVSMPTFFFRLLLEYLLNAPKFELGQTNFITWEPRDRTDTAYQVELLSLSNGTGSGEQRFDVADLGRQAPGNDLDHAMSNVNTTETGAIDREVRLRMKILAAVP